MGYCTISDILDMMDEDEVIRYTDDAGAGVINTDVTDKAMTAADALIDSHLAVRYSVPLAPVPDLVRDLAVDIAIYKIHTHRPGIPDEVRTKYDDAVKYLEKAASGKIIIPGAAAAPDGESSGSVAITGPSRIFSRDSLKEF